MSGRGWSLVLLAFCFAARSANDLKPLTIVASGLTEDYLEPCGCGGQDAGGLARRAEMLSEVRRNARGPVVVLEAGSFGVRPERLPLTLQAVGAMAPDACAVSADDLAVWDRVAPLTVERALPTTSVVPPGVGRPVTTELRPASRLIVGPPAGWRVGVVSACFGGLSLYDVARRCGNELAALRAEEVDLTVLVSHLGRAATEQLVARLETAPPSLILLATGSDLPAQPWQTDSTTWAPLARRGRSLSVVTQDAPGAPLRVEQRLVKTGLVDRTIQGWVDSFYERLRAGQETLEPRPEPFLAPSACGRCHPAAVAAWRQQPHARAVQTLVDRQRDVASCLRCHSEAARRGGTVPTAGDRGVQCATCHGQLAAHVKDPEQTVTSFRQEDCESCHNPENSPRWDYPSYLEQVLAACRAGDRGGAQ